MNSFYQTIYKCTLPANEKSKKKQKKKVSSLIYTLYHIQIKSLISSFTRFYCTNVQNFFRRKLWIWEEIDNASLWVWNLVKGSTRKSFQNQNELLYTTTIWYSCLFLIWKRQHKLQWSDALFPKLQSITNKW